MGAKIQKKEMVNRIAKRLATDEKGETDYGC